MAAFFQLHLQEGRLGSFRNPQTAACRINEFVRRNTPWSRLGFVPQKGSSALDLGSSRKNRRLANRVIWNLLG
jgi:hypothetical protein